MPSIERSADDTYRNLIQNLQPGDRVSPEQVTDENRADIRYIFETMGPHVFNYDTSVKAQSAALELFADAIYERTWNQIEPGATIEVDGITVTNPTENIAQVSNIWERFNKQRISSRIAFPESALIQALVADGRISEDLAADPIELAADLEAQALIGMIPQGSIHTIEVTDELIASGLTFENFHGLPSLFIPASVRES